MAVLYFRVFCLALFLGLSSFPPPPACAFWPPGAEGAYFFEAADGRLLEVRITKHSFVKIFTNPVEPDDPAQHYLERDYMQYDAAGNVEYLGQEMGLLSESGLEYARSFYPAAVFLDLPLEPGKTWASEVGVSPDLEPARLTHTVTGREEIATPLGVLPVTVVAATNSAEYLFRHAGIYKLNAEVGPVVLPGGYVLVGIEGRVAAESSSWGGLKALFR